MKCAAAATVSLLLIASLAFAQEEVVPPKHLKDAQWLMGTWESRGTVAEGDEFAGQDYVFRADMNWVLEKNAIAIELTPTVGEQTLTVSGMIGWDPSAKKLVSYTFSSIGGYGRGEVQIEKDRMQARDTGFFADGSESSYKVEVILKDKNTLLRKVTERKRGDRKLPDIEDVLRRIDQQ